MHGLVYMRDLDEEIEEDFSSLSLFEALVGEAACETSTIAVMAPSDSKGCASDDPRLASINIPAVTLLGTAQAACLDVLEQLFQNPPIQALYPSELAQGIKPSNTTAGQLFGKLLDEAENTIIYARHHLNGTAVGKDVRQPTIAAAARSHRRADSGLMKDLEESRRQVSYLETCISSAQQGFAERIAQLEESNNTLQLVRTQLETKNADLERSSHELQSEVERLRNTSSRPSPQQATASVQTEEDPLMQVTQSKATVEAAAKRMSSLQTQLEQTTTEKKEAIARADKLSTELADLKKSLATSRHTSTELQKEIAGLTKKVEGLLKAAEKKDDAIATAKAEAQTAKGESAKAKGEHDKIKAELTSIQTKVGKLEAERQSALKISEELLKDKKKLEGELDSSKSQVEGVQKQAKKKLDALQKLLDEKDIQLGSIAKAASAWESAHTQVESLQRDLAIADTKSRDAKLAIGAIQATLEKQRASWDLERASAEATVLSLKADRDAVQMGLNMEEKLRELEVNAYTTRIAELEEWGSSRWDAVGLDCVIA